MKNASPFRLVLLFLLVATVGAVLVVFRAEVREHLESFLDTVRNLGPWGPVVLGLAYVPSAVFFIPGSLLTLGAGFAFGVVVGTITVSLGSVGGASAAFFVGRFLARGWVEQRVASNPRFKAIDQAVAEQGFKIVLLTRLSPVFPFTLLNYAFGLTRVRFRDYLLASWIGMLPGTMMYVYIGSAARSIADLLSGNRERSVGEYILFVVGLVATVVVTVFVTRVARQALARALPTPSSEPSPGEQHS